MAFNVTIYFQYFCPGIIKAGYNKDNSVAVDFENEETPLIYSNVLSKADFDTIVADNTPNTSQITAGSKVCLRISSSDSKPLYVEALVYEIRSKEVSIFFLKACKLMTHSATNIDAAYESYSLCLKNHHL